MEKSKRFSNAIDALVNGYMNNTLLKGSCSACAVGNIVVKSQGLKLVKNTRNDGACAVNKYGVKFDLLWSSVFVTIYQQHINPGNYVGKTKKEIDSTGYTWQELARVEEAFELNTEIEFFDYGVFSESEIDEDQLKGLHAVVDVLCDIEGYNDEVLKETKELFVKI